MKNAAAELAKLDGVSLNQFIAVAVAEKVGALRTAAEFLQQRAGTAKPKGMIKFLRRAPKEVGNIVVLSTGFERTDGRSPST